MVLENLGPHPIRVYSHTERRRIMKERGLEECIRHTPVPGTDKSPHTQSWATTDPYTLEAGRVLVSRRAQAKSDGWEPEKVLTGFTSGVLSTEEAIALQEQVNRG